MNSNGLAEQIERAAYRSWPAAEVVEYDGWQLRYADGFSRRGNSVYPAAASTLDHAEKLDWCRTWYRHRNLDLVVRLTPAAEDGLDGVLDREGFTAEGRTDVMVADLETVEATTDVLAQSASAAWRKAMAGMWGIGADRAEGWQGIIDRIDLPAGFGLVAAAGEPQAAGLAVVDSGWLGLFEIIVAKGYRRRGIGQTFTRSLMRWGRANGAQRAYLQVVADNAPAIGMYEQLGFSYAYSYWYRRAPAG